MEIIQLDGSTAYLILGKALLTQGELVQPRSLPTRELRNVTIRVTDPLQVHVGRTSRRVNPKIAATEALQLLAGISNLDQLDAASGGRFSRYADDHRLVGAYGPRLYQQLPAALARLREDEVTRQALVTLWQGRELVAPSRDVPCTVNLQFLQRHGTLELRVNMRSNDAWLGLPYDWLMFGLLHAEVANALGVRRGHYVHSVGSLHLYEEHVPRLERLLELGLQPLDGPLVHGLPHLGDAWHDWDRLRAHALTLATRTAAEDALTRVRHPGRTWWLDHVAPVAETTHLCLSCRYAYDEATTPHRCRVVPDRVTTAVDDLLAEYVRARTKHGVFSLDGDEIDDLRRAAAVGEEFGEAMRELTYDHADPAADQRLRHELIQLANTAITWASVLPRLTPDQEAPDVPDAAFLAPPQPNHPGFSAPVDRPRQPDLPGLAAAVDPQPAG